MSAFDTQAQCLLNDGNGNFYLCPRYRRDEGECYFAHMRKRKSGSVFAKPPFPSYITLLEGLNRLHFYHAVIEGEIEPLPSIGASLSKRDIGIDSVLTFAMDGTNMLRDCLSSVKSHTERES